MNRDQIKSKLVDAEPLQMYSKRLINADEDLAGLIKYSLFGEYDDLLSDVFDEGTEMILNFVFTPSQVQVSVPRIGDEGISITYDEFEDASLATLSELVEPGV